MMKQIRLIQSVISILIIIPNSQVKETLCAHKKPQHQHIFSACHQRTSSSKKFRRSLSSLKTEVEECKAEHFFFL